MIPFFVGAQACCGSFVQRVTKLTQLASLARSGVEQGVKHHNVFNVVLITSNMKLLGAPGIATRNKDATRGSWPYLGARTLLGNVVRSLYRQSFTRPSRPAVTRMSWPMAVT